MIRAIIFDMDGVLIDSEPLWRDSLTRVMRTVGIEITEEILAETTGVRTDEVIAYRYRKTPWTGKSQAQIIAEVLDDVIALIRSKGEPMPGVPDVFAFPRSLGLPIALASSSPMRVIDAIVDHLGIRADFDMLRSAEYESFGKPHPAIFLRTAQDLGVAPEDCLVIEDSLNGVIAAKAAKMQVIAIPDAREREMPEFILANRKLMALSELNAGLWRELLKQA